MRLSSFLALLAGPLFAACGGAAPTVGAHVLTDPLRSIALDHVFTARADARVLNGFYDNVLRVRVLVTNASSARATLEIRGGCPVLLRVYRENATTAAFDESNSQCTLPLGLITLDPGQQDSVLRDVNVQKIVRRGATQAEYRIEALLAANVKQHEGPYVLDAGYVTIP